ncbi:hypothetical protein [Corynebacterium diphtheriae]|uniref:hypothetical protein n=1 Tax=Corynebacterium diphtheriae TaxID=1717 RepID=UPI001FD25534|nr:hypothetical protein [Corynebacterium diphtheriae]
MSDVGGVDQAPQYVVVEVGEDVFAARSWFSWLPACGVFVDGLDGLGFDDDDISVRLHGRFLVVGGWFRHPYSYKAKDPSILCYARTLGELINAL